MTYSEKLKDQRWQKKRLEILESSGWECQVPCCQNSQDKPTLHVHHKLYLRKTDPWDYPDWAYQVVCEDCHVLVQHQMERAHSVIAKNQHLLEALSILSNHGPEVQELFSDAARDAFICSDADIVKSVIRVFKEASSIVDVTYSEAWRKGLNSAQQPKLTSESDAA